MKTIFPSLIRAALGGCVLLACSSCTREAKFNRRAKQADAHFASGEFEAAEIEYKNALAADPLNPRAIAQLGLVYFEQGRHIRAQSYLSKAVELQPKNAAARLKLGMLQLAGGRRDDARAAALQVLELSPQDPEAPLLLVEASATPQQAAEARSRLQQLPAPASTAPAALVALGMLDMRERNPTRAEEQFKRALAADPKFAPAHSALSVLYSAQRDTAKAQAALQAAADASPLRSLKRVHLASFKSLQGDPAGARQILGEITRQHPDFLPAWLALAQVEEAAKRYDASLAALERVTSKESLHPDAMLMSARVRLEKGDHDKAIEELERMASVFAQAPQVHYQLGQAYAAAGNAAKALASLNQALTLAPNYVEAIVAQANLNIRRGDNGPAVVAALKKALQQRPDLLQAHMLLADAYRGQGNFDQALAVYADIEKRFPRLPQTALLSGLILARQNKPAEARKALERATELAPAAIAPVEQLVALDFNEKKPDAARSRVEAFIAKNPKSADGYILLSRVMLSIKDQQMAEMALQKAIAVDPESTAAYQMLARLQLNNNEPGKALANLKSILERNPRQADALMLISIIQQQQKNYAAARESYEKLIEVNPRFGAAYNNLAYLYSEHLGDLDRALEMAQKARQLLPHDPNTADTLGWVQYKKGQYASALPLLEESADKLNTSAEVHYHLGLVHYMMGDIQAASTSLKKALELDANFPGHEDATRRLSVLAMDTTKPNASLRANLERMAASNKNDPVVLRQLGSLHAGERDFAKAVSSLEAALALTPASPKLMVELGWALLETKDLAKAAEMAKNARKLAPDDLDAAQLQGRVALESGNHSWAYSLFQETARKRPEDRELKLDLGMAALAVGRLEEAGPAIAAGLAGQPTPARGERGRHLAKMIQGIQQPGTIPPAALDEILKKSPGDAAALMARAAVDEKSRNFKAAQAGYEKALTIWPDSAELKKRLAAIYAQVPPADAKMALEMATKAREAFPEDAEVARSLGIILYRQDNYFRARTLLQECVAKRDQDGEAFFYLGMARHKLKSPSESAQALNRALEVGLPPELAAEARRTLAAIASIKS